MILTGLQKLDKSLSGGIPDGVIVDIFGKNGTGKTQLLLQLAINSIRNGGHVLYFDTTGGFRPERILDIQKISESQLGFLNQVTVSRLTNTSEQINSIKNIDKNFSLILIDNVTDLFSYEYKNDESIFVKNSLFMKYMHDLANFAISNKVPVIITNMIRNLEGKEIENMKNAIDPFTHIKIHLTKNSSKFNGKIYSAFIENSFSYTINQSGLSSSEDI
ncbi:ATPase domain-containing protein [Nitrosopumilus sp. b2]|uniref:ATPase domain-containing protein n=1 Tax=Nitrosopumilus sp. b2 TaxID=2109908 RepID=UPI0015F6986B|nr:ATPase domain-containing protein [Nitrosopumilus sp. b2]KAF6245841.1 recombinase RecA [Nitrosopumilus sp. b2]